MPAFPAFHFERLRRYIPYVLAALLPGGSLLTIVYWLFRHKDR